MHADGHPRRARESRLATTKGNEENQSCAANGASNALAPRVRAFAPKVPRKKTEKELLDVKARRESEADEERQRRELAEIAARAARADAERRARRLREEKQQMTGVRDWKKRVVDAPSTQHAGPRSAPVAAPSSSAQQKLRGAPTRPTDVLAAQRDLSDAWCSSSLSGKHQEKALAQFMCSSSSSEAGGGHGVTFRDNVTKLLGHVFGGATLVPFKTEEFIDWLFAQPVFSSTLVSAGLDNDLKNVNFGDPSVSWWTEEHGFTAPLTAHEAAWLNAPTNLVNLARDIVGRSTSKTAFEAECVEDIEMRGAGDRRGDERDQRDERDQPVARCSLDPRTFAGRLLRARNTYLWRIATEQLDDPHRYVGESMAPTSRADDHCSSLFGAASTNTQRGHELAKTQIMNANNLDLADVSWRLNRNVACAVGIFSHFSFGMITRETYEQVGNAYLAWNEKLNRKPRILEIARVLGAIGYVREMIDTALINSLHNERSNPKGCNFSQPGLPIRHGKKKERDVLTALGQTVIERCMQTYCENQHLEQTVAEFVAKGEEIHMARRKAVARYMREHTPAQEILNGADAFTMHGAPIDNDHSRIMAKTHTGIQNEERNVQLTVEVLEKEEVIAATLVFHGKWSDEAPVKGAAYRLLRFQNKRERENLGKLANTEPLKTFLIESGYFAAFAPPPEDSAYPLGHDFRLHWSASVSFFDRVRHRNGHVKQDTPGGAHIITVNNALGAALAHDPPLVRVSVEFRERANERDADAGETTRDTFLEVLLELIAARSG